LRSGSRRFCLSYFSKLSVVGEPDRNHRVVRPLLDIILGYAGIVSLGHAAFFGIGAYTAGLLSKFGWGEPISGLIVAAVVAGLVGFAVSFVIARFRHFTLIMITLGLGLLAFETANRAHWLTGGSDGLQGISIWPVLGLFKFDLYGYTAYTYSLAVLFVVFLGARRLINSPFGLALRGIRENWVRMPAIGADSRAHIRKAYMIAAAIADLLVRSSPKPPKTSRSSRSAFSVRPTCW
jgi:branched-chain amino acid transport system permease protein